MRPIELSVPSSFSLPLTLRRLGRKALFLPHCWMWAIHWLSLADYGWHDPHFLFFFLPCGNEAFMAESVHARNPAMHAMSRALCVGFYAGIIKLKNKTFVYWDSNCIMPCHRTVFKKNVQNFSFFLCLICLWHKFKWFDSVFGKTEGRGSLPPVWNKILPFVLVPWVG